MLLDNVVKPASLDHAVIAFTLDKPLPAGTEVAPYAPDPLPSGVTTLPYLVPETLSAPAWFFWVDDDPFAKFSHPTRFVFVDAATGAVRTTAQGWWPYIDGRVVEQWTTTLERWNPKNWAFNNIPAKELPKLIASSQKREPARGGLISLLFGHLDWGSAAYAAMPAGEAMVVVQGWAPGQVDASMTDDEITADGFGWDSRTPVFKPAGNKLLDIEEAIKKAMGSGAKDILFYWTGHGGRRFGGSYLNFQGTKVFPNDLADIFKKFPEVSFKVVIDACYGGGFAQTLIDSGKVQVFLSASSPSEVAYGDWDPETGTDPNPGDWGSEFSSGLWEDLQLILASPDLQKKARDLADTMGMPEFVGWLWLATQSALDKDATALNGKTHPVFILGTPPPFIPTPTPISTSLSFFHTAPGSYSNVFLDVKGQANTVVTVFLLGPSVGAPVTQTGTIGADGTLRITWTIYSYGLYSATGTAGEQSFTVQVNVS